MEGDGQSQTSTTFNYFLRRKPVPVPDVGGGPLKALLGHLLGALPPCPAPVPQEEDLLLGCKPQERPPFCP